jgi:hypothetical protein
MIDKKVDPFVSFLRPPMPDSSWNKKRGANLPGMAAGPTQTLVVARDLGARRVRRLALETAITPRRRA